MSASNVRTGSTPAAAAASTSSSTLRPRPNRLISGLSEGDETSFDGVRTPPRRIASPLRSPFDSRSVSPIPAAHPQRSTSGHLSRRSARDGTSRTAQLGGQPNLSNSSGTSLGGFWGSSWSTLQGLASELLGNDGSGVDAKDKGARTRKPLSRLNSPRSASPGVGAGQWGPAPTSRPAVGIGSGTREEREAAVRTEKRKALLLRNDSIYADALGRFKRRLSDEFESISAPPGEQDDRSALVYLHPVKKSDTLAGITIKYNISANVLRKANRMWPNDTVQTRNTLTLPVSACGVKGRPVPKQPAVDLLGSESEALSAGQAEEVVSSQEGLTNGGHSKNGSILSGSSQQSASSATQRISAEAEPPWIHDSWVLLPGDTYPTEIARLARKALGYFPPARRKSVSYSDLDTPATSIDLPRPSTGDSTNTTVPAFAQSGNSPRRPGHGRRLSNADNGYYPSYLAGPGGVGTMNKNVFSPGPAQDGLNKMFARYLTDVAPPRNQSDLYQPDMPIYSDASTPTGASTPTSTLRSTSNRNLESVGGQIESWMRRVATQAKQSMASGERSRTPRGPRVSVGAPGRGTNGIGDLIEMTDEFEIGGENEHGEADDGEDEEMPRGRRESQIYIGDSQRYQKQRSSATNYSGGAVARDRTLTSNTKAKKHD